MQSRWVMMVLIGSLAVAIALAASGPRPQLVSKLTTGIGRWLAVQLALATTPSHDPCHPAGTLLSWSAALDRALGEHLVAASGDNRMPIQMEPVGLVSRATIEAQRLWMPICARYDETTI
jgi:hypothetical protein